MAIKKKFLTQGPGQYLCTTDAALPTADSTEDYDFIDALGRKTDTSNTTVGATSSLMRYVKGILNTVTGTTPIVGAYKGIQTTFVAGNLKAAGYAISGAASGAVWIETVALEVLTGSESTAALQGLILYSNEAVIWGQRLYHPQKGILIEDTDLSWTSTSDHTRFVWPVGHLLTTGKTLYLKTLSGTSATSTHMIEIGYRAMTSGATLAGVTGA